MEFPILDGRHREGPLERIELGVGGDGEVDVLRGDLEGCDFLLAVGITEELELRLELVEGLVGGGFIYTAKEALHIGAVAKIETLVQSKRNPNDILDAFKRHSGIRKYIEGGDLLEYSAHMLPEGGHGAIGDITGNGLMIAGDSAGLLNMSLYKEGTNHAMESGRYAALTAKEAKEKGDFSKATLSAYEEKMKGSIGMQDLKKYENLPDLLDNTPEVMSDYPARITQLLVDYFTVSKEPKEVIQKRAIKRAKEGLSLIKTGIKMFKARKLM